MAPPVRLPAEGGLYASNLLRNGFPLLSLAPAVLLSELCAILAALRLYLYAYLTTKYAEKKRKVHKD
jgi:hypothetical protein